MSPTAATELVFITVEVDANWSRNVDMFDIPREYLHTETDEDVIMFLEVPPAELMVKLVPNIHRKYLILSIK